MRSLSLVDWLVALGCWCVVLLAITGAACAQGTQPVLRKDLKKDFGAVGNGRANDHAAFERAAAFFNQRAQTPAGTTGRAELHIPKGVYLVGRQEADGQAANLLYLAGCRNLLVTGDDSANTEIRYTPGLRYGAFDPATKLPYEAATAYFSDGKYGAAGGCFVVLRDCDNVTIANLNLNGNSPTLVVGGHWGDIGIQLPCDGMFVSESRRITLRRVAMHHFGRDGVQVLNHLAKSVNDPNLEGIVFENSTFDYNGRQGLSLTGANGFRAVNCSFSHTGRVWVPALGKPLYSNPGAGVDIEPESGVVANVSLENCRFVDNAGQGLVSDRYGSGPPSTKNIVISGGLLWGLTNWSAWIRQPDFLFKNCRIYGAFVNGCDAATTSEATRFVGCTFEDRPYHGQTAYGLYTLHSDKEARRMRFTNCRFIGTHSYLIQAIPTATDTASLFQLRNCTFLYDYTAPTLGAADKILGAVFSGNTVFQNGPHRSSAHRSDFLLGNAARAGTCVLQAPGSLQFLAPNTCIMLQNGLDIARLSASSRGAASVEVGIDNALVLNEMAGKVPELYIGPAARLVIRKGGALEILRHTKVTIAGELVVEEGAYFFRDPLAAVVTTGRGQLRVSPQAISSKHPTVHSLEL